MTTGEEFIADIDNQRKVVERLTQSNQSKIDSLAQDGVQLGPGVHALWKIDALVETILTSEEAKLIYAHNLEVVKKKFLDDLLKEIRQMKLTQGVGQVPPKLTIPGR